MLQSNAVVLWSSAGSDIYTDNYGNVSTINLADKARYKETLSLQRSGATSQVRTCRAHKVHSNQRRIINLYIIYNKWFEMPLVTCESDERRFAGVLVRINCPHLRTNKAITT